ncbi:helix-turn-helix domain-containing protein [Facklamia sp. 7083-14-GEN3]|uniref:helix-turn-helix domain-containing protein n=1 Tax=Facklamia sp. 7083-14-GEN3 TaxID=2973478 RepID=UPI00215C8032|nr:helix-turn-helix transcriptional regulator [Facklamia sp. 7083-14-GEN3]MCR8969606.1 helix-turn-helix domain-containing protein [Facklamia sp. 7083-14-GEN3]
MFGNKIKKLREKNSLTQKQLADNLSVSRSAVSKWETDTSYPDIATLIKISEDFEVSLDYLLKEDEVMVDQLNEEMTKGRMLLKWYIELPLFVIAFFGITFILNRLFALKFNIVSEIISALIFYGVYKWLNRKDFSKE